MTKKALQVQVIWKSVKYLNFRAKNDQRSSQVQVIWKSEKYLNFRAKNDQITTESFDCLLMSKSIRIF